MKKVIVEDELREMPVLIITAKPASSNKPFTKSEPLESIYALGIE